MLVDGNIFFSAIENGIFFYYIILIRLRKQRIGLIPSFDHYLAEVTLIFIFYGYNLSVDIGYGDFMMTSSLFNRTRSVGSICWVVWITRVFLFEVFRAWHVWWHIRILFLCFFKYEFDFISWFEHIWNHIVIFLKLRNLRSSNWSLTTFPDYNFVLNLRCLVNDAFTWSIIWRSDNRW